MIAPAHRGVAAEWSRAFDEPIRVPKVRWSREPEPSTVNEKTTADFTRVV
jgi:hypothetical protein